MARAHFVQKARKDYPEHDIKKGESYYWWAFRYGGKHFSKTPPKASQLTQSEFLSAMADIEERIGAISGDSLEDLPNIQSERDELVDELYNLAQEQEDKKSNMPEGLQEGQTGELLQTRCDECNSMAEELAAVDLTIEKEEGMTDDEVKEAIEGAVSDLNGVSYSGE